MLRCDSLPRLQLEWRRTLILCNRGWRTPLLAGMLAAFAAGVPQMAGFMQSRPGRCPLGRNACRVCSWSAADGRFHAIATGKMPLWAGMLAAFAAGVPQKGDFVQSRPGEHPVATAHAVCSGVIACRVCSWSAADGRFCAIAAEETNLLAGMLAAFAAGVPQMASSVQSRPGRCPSWPECLPRLQLEWRRWPFSCNRGRRNAPCGRNACRVCSWSAADGQFRAIAAGKMPLLAEMFAAFASGVPQKASFMQSRLGERLLWPECVPRLLLEWRRRPISCNRGQRNAPFGQRNAPLRPAKRPPSASETPLPLAKITPGDRRGNRSGCSSCGRSACGRCGRWRIR